jgi:rhodanese-related sulfurtransferase
MRTFTPRQLKDYLENDGDALLLDVREGWEFTYCHIEGSELIPMGEIQENIDSLDPEQETVVICHYGIRSRQVAYYLESQGFDKVINLEQGIDGWALDIDPTMKRY